MGPSKTGTMLKELAKVLWQTSMVLSESAKRAHVSPRDPDPEGIKATKSGTVQVVQDRLMRHVGGMGAKQDRIKQEREEKQCTFLAWLIQ